MSWADILFDRMPHDKDEFVDISCVLMVAYRQEFASLALIGTIQFLILVCMPNLMQALQGVFQEMDAE